MHRLYKLSFNGLICVLLLWMEECMYNAHSKTTRMVDSSFRVKLHKDSSSNYQYGQTFTLHMDTSVVLVTTIHIKNVNLSFNIPLFFLKVILIYFNIIVLIFISSQTVINSLVIALLAQLAING